MSHISSANKAIAAIRIVVYLIAIVGVAAWGWKNFGPASTPSDVSPSNESTASYVENSSGHVVVVTYFTSDVRCPTCLKIEKLTNESINNGFSDELKKKEIVFQTINFDKPENKHYVKDYGLAFKTVVISERKKGKEVRWAKYDKVWDLVNTPEPFADYLSDGIRKYLEPEDGDTDTTSANTEKK